MSRRASPLVCVFVVLALLLSQTCVAYAAPLQRAFDGDVAESPARPPGSRVSALLGQLPVYFIENRGVTDPQVAYYVQGKDKTLYFTPQGVTFVLNQEDRSLAPRGRRYCDPGAADWPSTANGHKGLGYGIPTPLSSYVLKLEFLGANPGVVPVGVEPTGAVVSYFKGAPSEWNTGLGTYTRIVYHNLWPGIDLAFCGTSTGLKYEFTVHPGADPSLIQLAYRGADGLRVNDAGRLVVSCGANTFEDEAPVAWQEAEGERVPVVVRYELVDIPSPPYSGERQGEGESDALTPHPLPQSTEGEGAAYSFRLGHYDASLPLVIDPIILVYCGYIGGVGYEAIESIAVDRQGQAYVCGWTASVEAAFPVITGPDLSQNGGSYDAFVAKVAADGTSLIYCGYIGGSRYDSAYGIAVDANGRAVVVGSTQSDEISGAGDVAFPVAVGPDVTFNGPPGSTDGFIAKLNINGTALVYCGYIGGSDYDSGLDVALDSQGRAYVGGYTASAWSTFPETVGPDLSYNGLGDAFVARVNAAGTGLDYCGYLGGSDQEDGSSIAVDSSGCAYISGWTKSTEATFPETVGPDLTFGGGYCDGYVAKVAANGASLVYCGFLGGDGDDRIRDVAVDSTGAAYVCGGTWSTAATFPHLVGPDLTFNGGQNDAFVAKVRTDGTALTCCGYIGGDQSDGAASLAVDGMRRVTVVGGTYSGQTSFPVLLGPDLVIDGYFGQGYIARVKADFTGLMNCGYINGTWDVQPMAVALDTNGEAYFAGQTSSAETELFPVLVGPDLTYNEQLDGTHYDGFVAKLHQDPVCVSIAPSSGTAAINATRYFTTTWSEEDGVEDLKWCMFIIGTTPSMANTVYLNYNRLRNTLMIRSDDGQSWYGGRNPGWNGYIQNVRGAKVDCLNTTVSVTDKTVTVHWVVQFKNTFAGTKNLYLRALDMQGVEGGSIKKGTVTIS